MNVSLWQMFAVMTWLAVCLATAFASELPVNLRIGIPAVVTGFVLTFGRVIFPRPPIRAHVEKEEMLRRLSDLFVFGPPAGLLLLVGFSCFGGLLFGVCMASVSMLVFGLLVFSPDWPV